MVSCSVLSCSVTYTNNLIKETFHSGSKTAPRPPAASQRLYLSEPLAINKLMPREKSRYRSNSRRRSSSSASESSHDRHRTKSRRRKRSRSRESESSRRRSRRSSSRGRYTTKTKKRSTSRTRSKKSSRRSKTRSRERGRSRSSSRDKYRSSKSSHKKSSRRRSRSSDSRSSRSPSTASERTGSTVSKKVNLDDTESKIERAIKAAEAAGLTMTKPPTYEYKEVPIKEDMPTIQDRNLLQEINNDSFVSKPFVSSRSKKFSENIVIDLDTQTVKIPEVEIKEEESLLKFEELPSEEELKEMWIKKLFLYRKKMLREEI